jgi:hypothetical protein
VPICRQWIAASAAGVQPVDKSPLSSHAFFRKQASKRSHIFRPV